jgi:membrane-associated protease RseP (regulator of RpoE activity)
MPLDSSLLAFEKELRSLRPMEMDFPTGQQVWRALEREMSPASAAPPALHLLEGTKPAASAATHSKWNHLSPWAAAAALVLASWVALPHLPHRSTTIAAATETAKAGLIPYADRTSEKGSVAPVFPVSPKLAVFGDPASQLVAGNLQRTGLPSVSIPEATSPYGLLDVDTFDLPEDYCRARGLQHGVALRRVGLGGPASTHGLEVGDIIIRINGAPVSTSEDFAVMVKNSAPGSVMTLKVLRGRLLGEIPVRLGSAPSA